VLAHVFDVLWPCVDERHVVAGARHESAGVAADRAGAYYYDAFTHVQLSICR
jgi:hypothetical protein